MTSDDETRFRVRPGRLRADPGNRKVQSFLTRMRTAVRKHGGSSSARRPAGASGTGPAGGAPRQPRRGVRKGRGASFVRARHVAGGWSHQRPGSRRVVVKSRMVRDAGKGGRAAAHLRYIQRDGTSREGERGQLYSATEDRAESREFLERGADDRHQFRFIVSPEDAADLAELTAFTRDLMAQMEADLGTRLDWVAVNHFNTGHPHVHIVLNGRDDQGADLVINGEYITHGVRERATELVTLELGPVTEIEQRRKLEAAVEQDRFTPLDRALLAEAEPGLVDMRHDPDDSRLPQHGQRLRRLAKLERMGLARQYEPGVWQLDEKLEATLRELGARGDIYKSMHQALGARGRERDPATFTLHDAAPASPVVGRLIDKHLTDELGETISLVVDGIDGRVHHVAGVDPAVAAQRRIGSIVEAGPTRSGPRRADRAIAALAGDEGGIYRPSRHLDQARVMKEMPGGDPAAYVEAHVRRLEALRRAGIAERLDADTWRLPADYAERAAAYDAARNRRVSVRTLSNLDLEAQIGADGATWLDRRLVRGTADDIAPGGFGQEVADAMARRTERLVQQGDARRMEDGRISYRAALLATLERRELQRVGANLASRRGLPFRDLAEGDAMRGTLREQIRLASGTYALVENAQEFALVPWKPVIDNRIGQEVSSVMRGGAVNWQLGRERGLGL
jgi:type IV secretory pathway VirD2 relaxase